MINKKKKLTKGIVWVESSRGNWRPFQYDVTGNGATEEQLEESIRKQNPSCRLVIFSEKKPGSG